MDTRETILLIVIGVIALVLVEHASLNQPPVIEEITVPATVLEGQTFEATVVARDPGGALKYVELSFNGATEVGEFNSGTRRASFTATFTAPNVLEDRDYVLVARAYDDASNVSIPEKKTIRVVANKLPVIEEFNVPDTVLEGETFEVSARARDPEGALEKVTFTFNGETKVGMLKDNMYKARFTAPEVSKNWDYTLTVKAYDKVGGKSVKVTTVVVENEPKKEYQFSWYSKRLSEQYYTYKYSTTHEGIRGIEINLNVTEAPWYGIEVWLMTEAQFLNFESNNSVHVEKHWTVHKGEWTLTFNSPEPYETYYIVIDNTDYGWVKTDFDGVDDYAYFRAEVYFDY